MWNHMCFEDRLPGGIWQVTQFWRCLFPAWGYEYLELRSTNYLFRWVLPLLVNMALCVCVCVYFSQRGEVCWYLKIKTTMSILTLRTSGNKQGILGHQPPPPGWSHTCSQREGSHPSSGMWLCTPRSQTSWSRRLLNAFWIKQNRQIN